MIRHAISPRFAMRRERITEAPPRNGEEQKAASPSSCDHPGEEDQSTRHRPSSSSSLVVAPWVAQKIASLRSSGRDMGGAVGGEEGIFEDHHPGGGRAVVLAVAVD